MGPMGVVAMLLCQCCLGVCVIWFSAKQFLALLSKMEKRIYVSCRLLMDGQRLIAHRPLLSTTWLPPFSTMSQVSNCADAAIGAAGNFNTQRSVILVCGSPGERYVFPRVTRHARRFGLD